MITREDISIIRIIHQWYWKLGGSFFVNITLICSSTYFFINLIGRAMFCSEILYDINNLGYHSEKLIIKCLEKLFYNKFQTNYYL